MSMREVTQDEFFARMNPMNVHPRPLVDRSSWETPDRRVIGESLPGYRNPGDAKRYFLASEP